MSDATPYRPVGWRRFVAALASKRLLHVTLPAIMVYLVLGTLAQKSMGTFEATQRFFLAPVVELYGIPLPGMPLFMGLLVLNLLAHLCLTSEWRLQRISTLLTHFGVVFLLASALLTSLWAQEGYVNIRVGGKSNYVSDYQKREVVIRDLTSQTASILSFDGLMRQVGIPQHIGNSVLTVKEICRNCSLNPRLPTAEKAYGMAKGMQLSAKPLAPDSEQNLAGISFTIKGSKNDGLYTTLENVPVLPQFSAGGKRFSVAIEKTRRSLPFTVELLRTQRTLYPGSEEAAAYDSRLRIHDQGMIWEADLSMNQPVRYKGYALFQSSYIEDAQGKGAIIAVVHNPVRTFPYIATLMIALGLLLQLLQRTRSKGVILSALLVFVLCNGFSTPTQAADAALFYDLKTFSQLPIASDGRIKPIDSVAREQMRYITGTSDHAIARYFTILFLPEEAAALPLIKVGTKGVRTLLELPATEDGFRYTAATLSAAFVKHKDVLASLQGKTESELTPEQRSLREVYRQYRVYQEISHSLDAYRPLYAFSSRNLPKSLQQKLAGRFPLTYENSMPFQRAIELETKALVARKGANITRYSIEEQTLSYLSYILASMQNAGKQAGTFAVVHDTAFAHYVSPWAIVVEGNGGPDFKPSLEQWKKLIQHADDAAAWNLTAQQMLQQFHMPLGYQLEWYSNRIPLLDIALALYAAAFALLLVMYMLHRPLHHVAAHLLKVAVTAHALAVLVRIIILARPPVGTLYESILFAGLVLAASCLWRFTKTHGHLWLWKSALGGGLLLLLAVLNDLAPGDNKTMLTAVLNTNFWLTTHVLTITAGYAFSILTSLLAHGMLITRTMNDALYGTLKRAALLALLFAATGTLLGGIWADQSWGRFWGWDPKENGALLMVLWLVWFLHGDVARSMPRLSVIAGFASLAVVVAISWFGVNLLNIGLHSYGFTQGMQWGLAGFAAVEITVIGVCLWRISRFGCRT